MKLNIKFLIPVLMITTLAFVNCAVSAHAAPANGKAASKAKLVKVTKNDEISKNFSFEAANVNGKTASASAGRVTVENDKTIDDLLGVRKNFRDRLEQEKGRTP